MALHGYVKPRCHVSIWVISGIVAVLAVIFVGAAGLRQAGNTYASEPIGDTGSDLPRQPAEPAECVADEQQNSADQQAGGQESNDQQRQATQARHDELNSQLNTLNQRMSDQSLSDADRQSLQSQMESIRSQMQSLEQQAGGSSEQPRDEQPREQGSHEPSAACKAAIGRSAQSNLGQFKTRINSRIIPTLSRVDSIATQVEASIPHFREIGVEEDKIIQLQKDIATMRGSTATLRSFFQKIVSQIDAFLAKISDPGAAFDGLKNGFNISDQNTAGKAGDDLVAAFTDMQTIIDGIKE